MSRSKNLLEIWDLYSKQVVVEKKTAPKMAKPGPGGKNLNDTKAREVAQKDKTGPHAAGNFDGPAYKKNIDDVRTMNEKDKKDRPYVANLNVSMENFDTNMEKNTKTIINNNMKSTFDKLFEEVMGSDDAQDLEALGVGTEVSDELGDEGGAEVTITLSPEQVECLRAILAQVEGGAEGEDLDAEAETSMPDDDMGAQEDAEEAEEGDGKKEAMGEASAAVDAGSNVPDSAGMHLTKVSSGSNKVGDKTAKLAGKGSADSKVTGKVDAGSNVPDSAGLHLTKVSSGSNVVKSKLKAGAEAFGIP